jgi:hypothetical protein
VSILILGFGVLLLIQGIFPKGVEAQLDRIPGQQHLEESPIPPVDGSLKTPPKEIENVPKIKPIEK